jgi:diacylglycerol kinase (ATP)
MLYNVRMKRRRYHRERHAHYCLLVNPEAGNYDQALVQKLARRIRKAGARYTILEPDSPIQMLASARKAAGIGKVRGGFPTSVHQRGSVTALVACGGDGTFNLVGRAAVQAGMPIGLLPMGTRNDIGKSLGIDSDANAAIEKILKRKSVKIDTGLAAGLPFFGSIGIGLIPELSELLEDRKAPRFGFGWASLAGQAAANISPRKRIVIIDAFRFEISPHILNCNLLPYSSSLRLSPASLKDDGHLEVLFDVAPDIDHLSDFVKQIHKGKYFYGTNVRLYRGQTISIQPTKDEIMYLDGELVALPTNVVEVQVGEDQLTVFC